MHLLYVVDLDRPGVILGVAPQLTRKLFSGFFAPHIGHLGAVFWPWLPVRSKNLVDVR